MEEKYREILNELLYLISKDVYSLLNEDDRNIVDAITFLSERIEDLSEDIYKDKVVYERSEGKVNFWFDLV